MRRPLPPGPNHGRDGFDDALTAFWHHMETEGGPSRRAALRWIAARVADHLGADWFAAALERPDLFMQTYFLPCHRALLVDAVERSIRLEELDGSEGFARTRTQLRTNLTPDSLVHTDAVMEVAALAGAIDVPVRFEVRLGTSPIDLVLGTVPVEVTAVHLDQPFRDVDQRTSMLGDAVRAIGFEHGVEIDLVIHDLPGDDPSFLESVRDVLDSIDEVPLTIPIDGIEVTIRRDGPLGGLTGPEIATNYLERVVLRIEEKAAKSYADRSVWLRVEVLNGLWAFPRWATTDLREKLESLRRALVPGLRGSRLAGVILTPGALTTSAPVEEETCDDPDGSWAIRRNLPGWRAREVILLTVDPEWAAESGMWRDMYEAEPSWLDHAVVRHGLPAVVDLY